MCLTASMKTLEGGEGTGYKIVRRVPERKECCSPPWVRHFVPDTYTPFWTHFYKTGEGGVMGGGFSPRSREKFKVKCQYIIGRVSRVTHKRMAKIVGFPYNQHYPAGIHLYKNLNTTREILNDMVNTRYNKSMLTIIECEYRKAVAEDSDTIVAMEITPRKEVGLDETVQESESVHGG